MKHLVFDGYHGFRSRLDDILLINEFLEEMPAALGLQPIMPPFLLPYYNGVDPEDCGISAFLFVMGGHITIHTFSYREALFADVLAPIDFSESNFRNLIEKLFPSKTQKLSVLRRDGNIKRHIQANVRVDFGPHLFLKYNINERMTDIGELFKIFDRLPRAINMTPIMRPYVVSTQTKNLGSVLSVMTMIAESHISCHVFIKSKRAFFDIFSCRFFKTKHVLFKLSNIFGLQPVSVMFRPRGIGFKKESMSSSRRYVAYSQWTKHASKRPLEQRWKHI
jgi:S-adenosylmethionine/arginine decarboxylase-like enzyme